MTTCLKVSKLAAKYNEIAGKGAKPGLVDAKQSKIEDQVTQKILDGAFLLMAEQEKATSADPIGAATALARRVFGLAAKQLGTQLAQDHTRRSQVKSVSPNVTILGLIRLYYLFVSGRPGWPETAPVWQHSHQPRRNSENERSANVHRASCEHA